MTYEEAKRLLEEYVAAKQMTRNAMATDKLNLATRVVLLETVNRLYVLARAVTDMQNTPEGGWFK